MKKKRRRRRSWALSMAAMVARSDLLSMITYCRYIKIGMNRVQHITEDSIMVTYRTLEKWMRIMSAHCLELKALNLPYDYSISVLSILRASSSKTSSQQTTGSINGDSLFLRDQLNKTLPTSSCHYRNRYKFWNFVPWRVQSCEIQHSRQEVPDILKAP